MLPVELTSGHFANYPPEGRRAATKHLELLRRLPLGFVPLLLREVIVYDWKFPAERQEVDGQFSYLDALPPAEVNRLMAGFAALRVGGELARFDWVNDPAGFSERLTSLLWSSQQIGDFRTAATRFISDFHAAMPKSPPAMRRLAIAVIGAGVAETSLPLFQKLRPHGTLFTRVNPDSGWRTLIERVQARAREQPLPFAHWYVEGASPEVPVSSEVASVSWDSLAPMRAAIVDKMR